MRTTAKPFIDSRGDLDHDCAMIETHSKLKPPSDARACRHRPGAHRRSRPRRHARDDDLARSRLRLLHQVGGRDAQGRLRGDHARDGGHGRGEEPAEGAGGAPELSHDPGRRAGGRGSRPRRRHPHPARQAAQGRPRHRRARHAARVARDGNARWRRRIRSTSPCSTASAIRGPWARARHAAAGLSGRLRSARSRTGRVAGRSRSPAGRGRAGRSLRRGRPARPACWTRAAATSPRRS